MILRNPKLEGTHPKHGEPAVHHEGNLVCYCDSCGDWFQYNKVRKGCIRCDKPWEEEN